MATTFIEPAQLSFDADGIPCSDAYGDVYHSADGGPAQAAHVFLRGSGLPERWRRRAHFTIVETGFGLGLNFLVTWAALRDDPLGARRLHFVSAERHPLARDDLARAHAAWPHLAALSKRVRDAWPPLIGGIHRVELDDGRVVLTLLFGDAIALLSDLEARADAIYLDGFAPDRNPRMWSVGLFHALARISGDDTTVATWTVAGKVREGLNAAGFETGKRTGFGRKREMLVGRYAKGVAQTARRAGERHAAVIGAGLAGVWCAQRLAARGWRVDLIERHPRPAMEASGNPVGILRPALNLADNDNARLARAAFLYASSLMQTLPLPSRAWSGCGVLHVAAAPDQAERMQRILERHRFPADYARWVSADEARSLAGREVAGPGWWIERGGWVDPAALCDGLLAASGMTVTRRFGREAAALAQTQSGWRIDDRHTGALTEAPVVILANADEAARLAPDRVPPFVPVRGQVSVLPCSNDRRLDIVVCGDGYVAPTAAGTTCVGATFQPEDADHAIRTEDHAANLARLERMLPGFGTGLCPERLEGRASHRTATADRLPACGPLGEHSSDHAAGGGYLLAGLGARGLIWAPLCAEILACRLCGEPPPIERSLIEAIAPQRLFRAARS